MRGRIGLLGVSVLAVALGAILVAGQTADAALALHFQFNETGTTAINSGTLGGVANMVAADKVTPIDSHVAGGVTGAAGDSHIVQLGGQGVAAPTTEGTFDLGSFNQATITGWIWKSSTVNALGYDQQNILRYQDTSTSRLSLFGTGGSTNIGSLLLMINGKAHSSAAGVYNHPDEWMFFAVTYDGSLTTAAVKWYVGNETTTITGTASTTDLVAGTVTTLNVGNVLTGIGNARTVDGSNRAINGSLDDLRVYTNEVLSASELDAVRIEGMTTIPEPATMSVLALGALVAMRRRRS